MRQIYTSILVLFVYISDVFVIADLSLQFKACKDVKDESSCFDAVVPGTILTSMLAAGRFEDVTLDNMYLDMNLLKIPDIADVGTEYYSYTYVTSYKNEQCNEQWVCGRRILRLAGVNYRAQVKINGIHVLPVGKDRDAQGMFETFEYELPSPSSSESESAYVKIEIAVSPPDYPGIVDGAQGGDHLIAKNGPVAQFAAGWDWIRGTPDRMTGLWDLVTIEQRGQIEVSHPYIQDDIDFTTNSAKMTLSFDYYQESYGDSDINSAKIIVMDRDGNAVGEATVAIPAKKSGSLEVNISLKNVQLWWPHTHGDPYLYTVEITPTTGGPGLSFKHGFRVIENYLNEMTQGWAFRVNNKDVFITGGNWITTDQMLRYATSENRYFNEVRLHKEMGMNMIRVWGGGVSERDPFYQACDEMGVLVFQEFWMTGDNNGRWGGEYSYPEDNQAYIDNVKSVVLRLRTHASLFLWCAGNELYPKEENPKPFLQLNMLDIMKKYDPQRFFILSSMAPQNPDPTNSTEPHYDPSYAMANTDGPYALLYDVEFYRTRNPGLDGYNKTPMSFNPEIGSVGTPHYRSMQRFLSKEHLRRFPNRLSTVVDEAWEFHNYEDYNTDEEFDHIYDSFIFGGKAPETTEEYCARAQLVQHEQYKSLFEGFQAHAWEWYAGVLFWKSQTPWPALRGSLYDYYLAHTGGYWGVKHALGDGMGVIEGKGRGIHIQLDGPGSSIVRIVRTQSVAEYRSKNEKEGKHDNIRVRVEARTYTTSGELVVDRAINLTIHSASSAFVKLINLNTDEGGLGNIWPRSHGTLVCELRLVQLPTFDTSSAQDYLSLSEAFPILSRNTYHFVDRDESKSNAHTGTVSFQTLERNALNVAFYSKISATTFHRNRFVVKLRMAPNKGIAFMVHIGVVRMRRSDDGENEDMRVLPVFYGDNMFTIFPGQEIEIDVELPNTPDMIQRLHASQLYMELEAWNMPRFSIPISYEMR
jgi:hypothetical protein